MTLNLEIILVKQARFHVKYREIHLNFITSGRLIFVWYWKQNLMPDMHKWLDKIKEVYYEIKGYYASVPETSYSDRLCNCNSNNIDSVGHVFFVLNSQN